MEWSRAAYSPSPSVAATIVSAFQTAADILEIIKHHKEKRKWKNKEYQELLEIGILHRSLVEV